MSRSARVLYSGGTTGRPKAFRQGLLGVHPASAPPRHAELTSRLGIGAGTGAVSEQLIELCRERLAHFKAPRRVIVAGRLPRRPNGKLSLEGVRALVTSGKENP